MLCCQKLHANLRTVSWQTYVCLIKNQFRDKLRLIGIRTNQNGISSIHLGELGDTISSSIRCHLPLVFPLPNLPLVFTRSWSIVADFSSKQHGSTSCKLVKNIGLSNRTSWFSIKRSILLSLSLSLSLLLHVFLSLSSFACVRILLHFSAFTGKLSACLCMLVHVYCMLFSCYSN
ncbi:hypothetical protein O6H91_15G010400 [Diphasiastrum complanatum]|uniref:Uncharacterized protein n=1 Tax=Diphasiastrum complanatum TaxID=34168 RepID=A0ACC2BFW1_DIPCM|nr:hypothetical protein O6H91_15G010400 [Diphasiastrum complanatum]